MKISLNEADRGTRPEQTRSLRMGVRGWPSFVAMPWVLRHEEFVSGQRFVDVQVRGPLRYWRHVHCFGPDRIDDGTSVLSDEIKSECPWAWLHLSRRFLARIIQYRHEQVDGDLVRIRSYPGPVSPMLGPPLKVGITGSHGLVGSRLVSFLQVAGHHPVYLTRGRLLGVGEDEASWWPEPDLDRLEGLDAVVHLAGATVFQPWTASAKEAIYYSRTEGTRRLARAVSLLRRPPRVLICASAIGYYGYDQSSPVAEDGALGQGFLAETCRDWEAATRVAEEAGVRVCHLRIGLVSTASGGAIGLQLPFFSWGLGAVVGLGDQVQSFIDRDDLVAAIYHLINRDDLSGPFNATAPHPVTQLMASRMLAAAFNRSVLLRVPSQPLAFGLGEQADLLLRGLAVVPERLLDSGFTFHYPTLWDSLAHELGLGRLIT